MSNDEQQSFIRWQSMRIEQLSFVNNLLIGLATGMLAFQTQLAFDDKKEKNNKSGTSQMVSQFLPEYRQCPGHGFTPRGSISYIFLPDRNLASSCEAEMLRFLPQL